jgi:hypothetical protein
LDVEQHLGIRPKIFQAVVAALGIREDVDDQAAEIDQQPALLRGAFNAGLGKLETLDPIEDGIAQSRQGAFVIGRTDYVVITDWGKVLQIEQENILGFFILEAGDYAPGNINVFQ